MDSFPLKCYIVACRRLLKYKLSNLVWVSFKCDAIKKDIGPPKPSLEFHIPAHWTVFLKCIMQWLDYYKHLVTVDTVCLRVGLALCCLLTPGLSQDIWCHIWPYSLLYLQITRSDIRSCIKWAVSLMIANDQVIFLGKGRGGVWVCMINILTLSPS